MGNFQQFSKASRKIKNKFKEKDEFLRTKSTIDKNDFVFRYNSITNNCRYLNVNRMLIVIILHTP